ncbi:Protein of unknown function [Cotesia congregata]|uniref:Uncharacterized protein n=1 Tax=Cotesia congregata TaxID=51543 RepID=A0A8J2HNL2_COTCN|nr:Protein of unknown function [Cotesia congregata]
MKDVDKSIAKKSTLECRGIKGLSALSTLPNFDMVWSFPFDSMHTWDLGVTKFLWELIIKGLDKDEKERINQVIKMTKPPRCY